MNFTYCSKAASYFLWRSSLIASSCSWPLRLNSPSILIGWSSNITFFSLEVCLLLLATKKLLSYETYRDCMTISSYSSTLGTELESIFAAFNYLATMDSSNLLLCMGDTSNLLALRALSCSWLKILAVTPLDPNWLNSANDSRMITFFSISSTRSFT